MSVLLAPSASFVAVDHVTERDTFLDALGLSCTTVKVFSRSLARLFRSQCVAGGEKLGFTEHAVLGRCEVVNRLTIEVAAETTDLVARLATERQFHASTVVEDGQTLLASDQKNGTRWQSKDLNLVAIIIFEFGHFLVGYLN